MRISTFNVQNFYLKENENIDEYYNKLSKFIKTYSIDIIGMQEVVKELYNKFDKIIGKPRMIINSKYNEYNPIYSKYEAVREKTYHLPVLNSFIPRIATVAVYNANGKIIRIINTHLALYKYHFVKRLEFKKLIKIIEKENIPTILIGDLNLSKESSDLKYFKEELSKIDMKLVENTSSTYKNEILDFVFVSKYMEYKNVKVIGNKLSDHKALICDIVL